MDVDTLRNITRLKDTSIADIGKPYLSWRGDPLTDRDVTFHVAPDVYGHVPQEMHLPLVAAILDHAGIDPQRHEFSKEPYLQRYKGRGWTLHAPSHGMIAPPMPRPRTEMIRGWAIAQRHVLVSRSCTRNSAQ